ncbi:unnamed protein product, partial [Sphagnum troendelagicum]
MYTTPTLIQSTCSSSDASTWHPDQLTKKEKDQVTNLLIKYENVFAFSMKDL